MTMLGSERLILAIRSSHLPPDIRPGGYVQLPHDRILDVLWTAGLWVGPRAALEHLEDFRQVIPYVMLTVGERFVCYERMPAGGEDRLHGKLSIGLGGHIDFVDVLRTHDSIELGGTLIQATRRELKEELGIECSEPIEWLGILVLSDTPVSRVHVGVIGLGRLETTVVNGTEAAVDNVRLMSIEELLNERPRMEAWSQQLLPLLIAWRDTGVSQSCTAMTEPAPPDMA